MYALMCECVNGLKKCCAYVRKDVKLATDELRFQDSNQSQVPATSHEFNLTGIADLVIV